MPERERSMSIRTPFAKRFEPTVCEHELLYTCRARRRSTEVTPRLPTRCQNSSTDFVTLPSLSNVTTYTTRSASSAQRRQIVLASAMLGVFVGPPSNEDFVDTVEGRM